MNSWGSYLCLLVFVPLGCAVGSVTTTYEPMPFAHYQPILDRMPFGAPPPAVVVPDVDPELLKTAEQEKAEQQQVARQLSFSALNITPQGTTAVGFTDRGVNPPRSFYLEVGASADGWTVVAADYSKDWARFEKDGVTITMHLDKGLIDDPSSTNSVPALATAGGAMPVASEPASPPPSASSIERRAIRAAAAASGGIPGLVRRPSQTSHVAPVAAGGEDGNPQAQPASFLERRRATVAQEQAKEQAVRTAAEQANNEKLQELARKIARDELNKREQEQAETVDRLLIEQEMFARQREEAEAREAAEAEAAAAAQPEAEPEPEQEHE